MLGIPLAKLFRAPISVYLLFAALFFLLAVIFWLLNARQRVALLVIPLFLFYGAIRYAISDQPYPGDHVSFFHHADRHIYLTGFISDLPDERDTVTNIKLSTTAIDLGYGDQPASGTVLVKLYTPYAVSYGDRIRVYGVLDTPPESAEFSYREYLLNKGITSLLTTNKVTVLPGRQTTFLGSFTNASRQAIFSRVEKLFSPPEAYLIAGILIGMDKQIPPEVDQAFVDTGTSHIIAISGFNISIIAVLLITLFTRLFGRRWGTISAIVGIGAYTLLAGADPPVVRAAVMGSLGALGVLLRRRNATLTLLFFAGMLMAFFNPNILYEPGFQLSFAATLGIISLVPLMEDRFREWLSRFLSDERAERALTLFSDLFIITFAAQITTLPIILAHFGKLSLITFLANPLILPLQPALLILSGLAVILSFLWMPLGSIVSMAAYPFAWVTIWVVEKLAVYSGPSLHFNADNLGFIILYYALLLVVPIFWTRMKEWFKPSVFVPLAIVIVFLVWRQVVLLPDGKTRIFFPSVGKADAILITSPSGARVLINGGDKSSILLDALGRRISPFDKTLDLLVIANTQETNLAALPKVVDLYPPDKVIWSGNRDASYSSVKLYTSLTRDRVPVQFAEEGMTIELGDGLTLNVEDVNERGAVITLRQGGFSMFLPIGVNRDATEALAARERETRTGYYLSENGYPPSNPEELIHKFPAEFYILGFGFDNFAILPSQELLDSLGSNNIFRTDELGWIEIVTDGNEYTITSQYGVK